MISWGDRSHGNEMIIYDKDEEGMEFTVKDVTPEYLEAATAARAVMVEKIAGEDEALMENSSVIRKYLSPN